MMSRVRFAVLAGAMLAVAGVACASSGSSSEAGEGADVAVAMEDWSIQIDPGSVAAGDVTFAATNAGPTTHEFEIFSGENGEVPSEPLPVANGVADTAGLTLVDEVEDVFAGTEAELTVALDAGQYLLICNLPDHYEQGMTATLTVT